MKDLDQKSTDLNTIEQTLLVAWRKMSSTDQHSLMRFIEALVNTRHKDTSVESSHTPE